MRLGACETDGPAASEVRTSRAARAPEGRIVALDQNLAGRVVPGPGETILWLHGYTLDSRCWRELWAELPGHTHLGIDLPGHGHSLPLGPGDTLSSIAARIAAVAQTRGARHLVATSLSCSLALRAAFDHPGQFATVALAGPLLGGGPFPEDLWPRHRDAKAALARGEPDDALCDLWMAPEAALFRGTEAAPGLCRDLRHLVRSHPWWDTGPDAYAALWREAQSFAELRGVAAQCLVLVGSEDGRAVQTAAGLLERTVPHHRRIDLGRLGHHCLLEDPARAAALLAPLWRPTRRPGP